MILITDMDEVRAAFVNAMLEDMTVLDLWACAEHADTCADFENAIGYSFDPRSVEREP